MRIFSSKFFFKNIMFTLVPDMVSGSRMPQTSLNTRGIKMNSEELKSIWAAFDQTIQNSRVRLPDLFKLVATANPNSIFSVETLTFQVYVDETGLHSEEVWLCKNNAKMIPIGDGCIYMDDLSGFRLMNQENFRQIVESPIRLTPTRY
jgi:hypothetical protein